jgi:hypothetical protein
MLLFADLEAHANAAVLNQLSNVQVIIGGVMVTGIFRRSSSVANLGVGAADTSPRVTVASSAVMAQPVGNLIVVAGVPYQIVADEPDGTGLTLLTLAVTQ